MSIYVSDRRDLDILSALDGIPEGDKSWYLKELIRDGLRYRNGIEPPTGFIGRSTQVILPGANPTPPTPVVASEPKAKVAKKEKPKEKVIKKEQPKAEHVAEMKTVVTVEEPKPTPPVTPEILNPLDAFADIDVDALMKQSEESDDDLDSKLDSL